MNIKYFELVNNVLTIDVNNFDKKGIPFSELENFYNRYESFISQINVNDSKQVVKCADIWELQDVINT